MLVKIIKSRYLYIFLSVAVIIISFTFSLFTMNQYGVTWDEQNERQLVDAYSRYFETGNKEEIALPDNPELRHYGTATPFLITYTSKISQKLIGLNTPSANHLFIVFSGLILLIGTFLIARLLFNPEVAFYSVLFLSLFPHFIANTQYNPKDVPIAAWITISFFCFCQFIYKKRYLYAILAGIFMGVALATVVSAIISIPIFFVTYLSFLFFHERIYKDTNWKEYLFRDSILFLVFIVVTIFVLFVCWPVLWTEPGMFFSAIQLFQHHTWNGLVLFNGHFILASEMPWYYAPQAILMSLPILVDILGVFGVFYCLRKIILSVKTLIKSTCINPECPSLLFSISTILLWALIPIAIFVLPGAVNYDGIRHFFMVFPPLIILAAVGMSIIMTDLRNLFLNYRVSYFVSILFLLLVSSSLLIENIRIFPYGGSYYNELVRLIIPAHIENIFEAEYWGAPYREGVQWLNLNAQLDSTICVPVAAHLIGEYKIRTDLKLNFNCDQPFDYIMYITRGGVERTPIQIQKQSMTIVYKISRQNSDYLYIYKS